MLSKGHSSFWSFSISNYPFLIAYSYFRFGLIEPTYRDNLYGIPYPCRGLFIIDPSKVVRQMSFYPWSVGRSTSELLRTIDSLQLTDAFENKVLSWFPIFQFQLKLGFFWNVPLNQSTGLFTYSILFC